MRNPANNWIIEKKAAPMIHIHLESRISRWYDQINRKKNKAEAEVQPVSRHLQYRELLAYEKPCCLFIKAHGIDHAGGFAFQLACARRAQPLYQHLFRQMGSFDQLVA